MLPLHSDLIVFLDPDITLQKYSMNRTTFCRVDMYRRFEVLEHMHGPLISLNNLTYISWINIAQKLACTWRYLPV